MKRVYVNEKLCLNCRLCEVYCKVAHSKTKNIIKAYTKEEPAPVSRICVEGNNDLSLPVQCRHCEDPECVKACITGAMIKDTITGIVTNDIDRCVGCLTCLIACPYGAIIVGDVALKCDLCQSEDEPACVKNCPNNALIYVEGGSER